MSNNQRDFDYSPIFKEFRNSARSELDACAFPVYPSQHELGKTATDIVRDLGARVDNIQRVLDQVEESLDRGHYMTALETIRTFKVKGQPK